MRAKQSEGKHRGKTDSLSGQANIKEKKIFTQKVFIQISKTYGYTPILSNEKILYFSDKCIKNVLTFKEKPQYQCRVSQKNTQKLLNILRG